MAFRLKQLDKNSPEILAFHNKFCAKVKYDVPAGYFNKGDCFGLYVNGELVGGFCLVNLPPLHLRSITQIPDVVYNWCIYGDRLCDVCEFTGYFLDSRRHGLIFTVYLVWVILTYNASQFVYSYPASQKGLERYYSKGSPLRLYTGKPVTLEGIPGVEDEHVEVLTKWGIVKIFLHRTLRYFRRSHGKRTRNDGTQG